MFELQHSVIQVYQGMCIDVYHFSVLVIKFCERKIWYRWIRKRSKFTTKSAPPSDSMKKEGSKESYILAEGTEGADRGMRGMFGK